MPIVVVALRVRRLALAAAVEADRGPARKTSAPNGGPPPRREATARVPTDPCSRAWMRVRTVISFNPNLAHTGCAQPGGRRRAAMTGPPRSAAGNNGAYAEFAQRPCTRGHGDDRVLASATHGDLVRRLIATRPGAGDCRAYSGGRATTLYAAHGVAGCGSAGPIGTGPCRLIATRPECGRSPRVRGGARNDPIRGTRRDRMRQGRADRHRAVAVDRHQFGLGDRGAYAGAARNDPIRGTRRGRVRQCRGPSAPGSAG